MGANCPNIMPVALGIYVFRAEKRSSGERQKEKFISGSGNGPCAMGPVGLSVRNHYLWSPIMSVNVNVNLTLGIDIDIEISLNDVAGTYIGNFNAYGNAWALIGGISRRSCCVNEITRNQLN